MPLNKEIKENYLHRAGGKFPWHDGKHAEL